MAQAEMAFVDQPLASPQPTAPPHPRDLARQLYQRQVTPETCGWISANYASPMYCNLGDGCAYNTLPAYNAAFCCNAVDFPNCPFATTCLDSTAVAESCTGLCLLNTAVNKCTTASAPYCVTVIFSYSTIATSLTNWQCLSEPLGTVSVFDHYNFQAATSGGNVPTGTPNLQISVVTVGPASTATTSGGPSPPKSTTTPNGVPTPQNSPAASSSKSGISGGAIAGIVVGAIFLLVIVLGMFLLYRYKRGRHPPPPPAPAPQPLNPQPTNMATFQSASPPLSSRPSNFTMPSNTPLVPPPMTELSPDDSASNIGGFNNSTVSQSPPPDVSSQVDSYPTSQSALGALPQFSPPQGGQPVASPGTEFGSMPPVHAPDVNPGYTFVPKAQ